MGSGGWSCAGNIDEGVGVHRAHLVGMVVPAAMARAPRGALVHAQALVTHTVGLQGRTIQRHQEPSRVGLGDPSHKDHLPYWVCAATPQGEDFFTLWVAQTLTDTLYASNSAVRSSCHRSVKGGLPLSAARACHGFHGGVLSRRKYLAAARSVSTSSPKPPSPALQ